MRALLLLIGFVAILTSCKENTEDINIHEMNQQFISAWNTRNTDQVISYLADDVHFLQGEVHFQGKSEVADRWVRETIGTISDLKTNVVSSGTGDNMAYEAGTFSVDVLPTGPDIPGGVGEGNFMLLWKKSESGEWKLHYAQLEDLPVQAKNM